MGSKKHSWFDREAFVYFLGIVTGVMVGYALGQIHLIIEVLKAVACLT